MPVAGTQIPEITKATPVGYIGAPAVLMRAAAGADLKIIASFDRGWLSGGLVAASELHSPDQLRGRRLGARVTGAALWLHTVQVLEKLGLDPARDNIEIAEIGDPPEIAAALESGQIDGAVLSDAFCKQLQSKGFRVLVDLTHLHVRNVSDALVTTTGFLRGGKEAKHILAAMIEACAFATSEAHAQEALPIVKSTLKVENDDAAKSDLRKLAAAMAQKPFPSVERLNDMQRLMGAVRPAVRSIRVERLVDGRLIQELDDSGFIDRVYTAYSAGSAEDQH